MIRPIRKRASKSGPLGTGTIFFGNGRSQSLGVYSPETNTAVHYVLHNNIELGTSEELRFMGGKGSLTLDSVNSLDFGTTDRTLYTGQYYAGGQYPTMLVINSRVDASQAAVAVRGPSSSASPIRTTCSRNSTSE